MNIIENRNTLVIVANKHNPSVLFGDFLIKSGMIRDNDQINNEKSYITPAAGEITLDDNSLIHLDEQRLIIDSKFGSFPYEAGKKYCENLPHIPYSAVGINLYYRIEDVELSTLFSDSKILKYGIDSFSTSFPLKEGICYVTLRKPKPKPTDKEVYARFNCHYESSDDKDSKLGNLNMNFLDEWKSNNKIAKEFINNIMGK